MRKFLSFVGILVLTLMAAFVWPTQYRYDHIQYPHSGISILIRIDRINGNAEYLSSYGWLPGIPR